MKEDFTMMEISRSELNTILQALRKYNEHLKELSDTAKQEELVAVLLSKVYMKQAELGRLESTD